MGDGGNKKRAIAGCLACNCGRNDDGGGGGGGGGGKSLV